MVTSGLFGVPMANNSMQYGYDFATGQWGMGNQGPGGFKIAGGGGTNTATKSPAQVVQDIINNGTNAVPQGLKDLSQLTTNTLTSSAGVSAPVQTASDDTAKFISNLIAGGNPEYTGQRVAGLTDSEKGAQTSLDQLVAGGGPGAAAMREGTQFTDTSAIDKASGPVAAQKLTDVNMAGYMNPAQNAIYDSIIRGNEVAKNATRARQAKSRAFGANSDVAQAQNDDNMQRNLGVASAEAFRIAQGAAQGDVAAENATRQNNRTAAMSAAGQKVGAQLTDRQRMLAGGATMNEDARANAGAAMTAGQNARGVEQAGLDAGWEQYLTKLGLDKDLAVKAAGALGSLPGLKTLSQEQLGPSAAGQQIGALIGLTGLQQQYATSNTNGAPIIQYGNLSSKPLRAA